jgi:hypothetical protein
MNKVKENMGSLDELIESNNEGFTPGKIDRMLIISRPGVGKTKALMQLPDSIYFDLENSTGHFKGKANVVNIMTASKKLELGPISTIRKMTYHIKSQKKTYRFCIIDSISVIDDWAENLALANYKASAIGKNSTVTSIFEVPFLGYVAHRNAFQEIIDYFEGIGTTLILVAHVKDASIKKDGEATSVLDIRLTGTLREIMSSKQDVSGVMIFNKEEPNKRYLDFRKSEENTFMKCRAAHLAGRIVPISETTEEGEFVTHWDEIFLDLK